MSFATARRDIEKRLDSNWALTQIAYDNVPFTPPKDQSWVSLRIFEDDVRRVNIGNPGVHRVSGTISISLYAPENTGTKEIRENADLLADIFRDKQFNGITCREASLSTGILKDGWYMMILSIPFYWDGVYSA